MSLDQSLIQHSIEDSSIFSKFLRRDVFYTVILPPLFTSSGEYSLLLVNDGQDFDELKISDTLLDPAMQHVRESVVVVGIHANEDRLQEYGTAAETDYAGRGSKAHLTTEFVLKELLPFATKEFAVRTGNVVYAGFSLGGLMAMDMAWNHPDVFSKIAVFSGALWWRSKAINAGYSDADRIMHAQIRSTTHKPDLKFWFQTGTNDETDDRDGDGIIDSIQDTLECISELERKGYRWGIDISYVEVRNGEHNPRTWSVVFPEFLQWAFPG